MPEIWTIKVPIEVRRDHIELGYNPPNPFEQCPIALALTEQLPLPPGFHWVVDIGAIYISAADPVDGVYETLEEVETPVAVASFIRQFDLALSPDSLQPFTFEI